MRHRKRTFKIGRTGSHRRAMLANMVSSLIIDQEIKTTITKAKEARRLADKMVTMAKKGDLHRRRLAISRLRNKDAVSVLFSEIAPKFEERNGGYTRIIRLGQRRGDAAELCILQWVEEGPPEKQKKKKNKSAKSEKSASVPTTEMKEVEVIAEKTDISSDIKAEETNTKAEASTKTEEDANAKAEATVTETEKGESEEAPVAEETPKS